MQPLFTANLNNSAQSVAPQGLMKNTQPLFIVNFNNREDNLGDQFIFLTLINSLAMFGEVRTRSRPPQPASSFKMIQGKWQWWATRLHSSLSGRRLYWVHPPGGGITVGKQGVDSRANSSRLSVMTLANATARMFPVRKIALGRSLLPGLPPKWCMETHWMGVRDTTSLRVLQGAGHRNVEYFPDLAFLAPPLSDLATDRTCCYFSFRRSIPEAQDAHETYQRQLVKAISLAATTVISHGHLEAKCCYQVEEDRNAMRDIANMLKAEMLNEKLNLTNFCDVYSRAQFVFSNRLHSLLLGAYCGAIPIALTSSTHAKVVSLFETVGWGELVVTIDGDDNIEERVRHLLNSSHRLRTLVSNVYNLQREIGMSVLSKITGAS